MPSETMDRDVYIDTPVGGWAGRGQSTLVLGAGVSRARGIPLWGSLVDDLWKETLGAAGMPSETLGHPFEGQLRLEMIHRWLCDRGQGREAIADELVSWWASQDPPRELVLRGPNGRCCADDVFRELLRRALYRDVRCLPASDTLGVIAGAIQREPARGAGGARRRLARVITFNADSLLEREVNGVDERGRARTITLWPISAANTPPMRHADAIPIYHVHGCLPIDRLPVKSSRSARAKPRKQTWDENLYDDGDLVFRDADYWSSVASPLSFANRVVANALHDSRCIFIGLSMTDINLWRWLGVRAVEIQRGVQGEWDAMPLRQGQMRGEDELLWIKISHEQGHEGHLWIRTRDGDPTGRLSEFLARQRGVKTLRLETWSTAELEAVFLKLLP